MKQVLFAFAVLFSILSCTSGVSEKEKANIKAMVELHTLDVKLKKQLTKEPNISDVNSDRYMAFDDSTMTYEKYIEFCKTHKALNPNTYYTTWPEAAK